MHLRSVLALTDFSTTGELALERAAHIAAEHGAELRLFYAADHHDCRFSAPHARLEQRARQLARRHSLRVRAASAGDAPGPELEALVRQTDLLVVDAARLHSARGWWHGTTVSQLLRRHACPVLVVQQPARTPYRDVLVAVDLTPRARSLAVYASRIARDAALELFHALPAGRQRLLRQADLPLETLQSLHQATAQQAQGRLLRLSDSLDTRRNRYRLALKGGDPARQAAVQQQVSNADLTVVGKRQRPRWIDPWWPCTAWRLLPLVECDVLVVPDAHHTAFSARALTGAPA
jgi:nucleotide-binding universal stress UspA family protein